MNTTQDMQSALSPAGIFRRMEDSFHETGASSCRHRIDGLKRLQKNILRHREDIRQALQKDFCKPGFETDASETLIVLREIHRTVRELRYWMQDRRVDTDIMLAGASSWQRYEPRGVVLVIAPWNYPVNLSLSPLVAAYAAGNRIIIKPSELTAHTSAVLSAIVSESFDPDEVCVIQGGPDVAAQLTALPFNLIFYTGSNAKAVKVLAAAAENLTPVVTELGGKTPVIIDKDYPLRDISRQICFAKLLNAGQTCVAPDFVLLHRSGMDEFVMHWRKAVEEFYGEKPCDHQDYCGIINHGHFERLSALVDSALAAGATTRSAVQTRPELRKMAPVLLEQVDWSNPVMSEEIFGPVLPVITYENLEEVFAPLRKMKRPLALYLYSRRRDRQNWFLEKSRSGGISINQCLLNYCENNLPFGGDHHSGSGRYHGFSGFVEFSHQRSVARQGMLPSPIRLFHPPYTGWKRKMVDLLIRFFSN